MILTIEIPDSVVDELVTACEYRRRLDPTLFDEPLTDVTAEVTQVAFQNYLASFVPALLEEHQAKAAAYAVYVQTSASSPEFTLPNLP